MLAQRLLSDPEAAIASGSNERPISADFGRSAFKMAEGGFGSKGDSLGPKGKRLPLEATRQG
jgi:hypothetical protein